MKRRRSGRYITLQSKKKCCWKLLTTALYRKSTTISFKISFFLLRHCKKTNQTEIKNTFSEFFEGNLDSYCVLFWDLALVKANQCNYIENGVEYAITIFINVSDNSALLTLRLKGRFNSVLASFINGQVTKFKIFNFHKFARRNLLSSIFDFDFTLCQI